MTEMQQILAGMSELNERVQNAEARATEVERQAQATQQEWARSQAGAKGKEKSAAVPLQQEQGSARLRQSISFSRSRVRTTSGEDGLECFALGLVDFLAVRWQQSVNTLEDTMTLQQPSLT